MSPEEKAAADAEMDRRTQIAATQSEAVHVAQAASVAAQEQSRAEHQARLDAEVLLFATPKLYPISRERQVVQLGAVTPRGVRSVAKPKHPSS